MKKFCEGFYFKYYEPDACGQFKKAKTSPLFRQVEDKIIERIRQVLRRRPDLLRKIACMSNAIEIHIYNTNQLIDKGEGGEFVGRVTRNGDQITMEFAIGDTLYGLENSQDGFEVITHELAHLLDFITEPNGIFPGWTRQEIAQFKAAQTEELEKIRKGTSPMAPYALVNHEEFLAVLAETFFEKPDELQDSNPVLYNLMREFFQTNPLQETLEEATDNMEPV
jgi:hypothetical protein